MDILRQFSEALMPIALLGFLAMLAVLCHRLLGYAREARRAREDVRVLEALMAEGFSPQDADEAVRSSREGGPLP